MYLTKTSIKNSPIQGTGYFSEEFVPIGTIIYVYGEADLRYSNSQFQQLDKLAQEHLSEYGVEDEFGNWTETKTGPYTNHSCSPNIMPIYIYGQYVNIVVKDINIGDEITLDYALFFSSTAWTMKCTCGSLKCRDIIGFGLPFNETLERSWQELVEKAILNITLVRQPLYLSNDKYAKDIAEKLKVIKSPILGRMVKFTIINDEDRS